MTDADSVVSDKLSSLVGLRTSEIVAILQEEFEKQHGLGLRGDFIALLRLMNAADEARLDLATADLVTVRLPYIHNTIELVVRVSREALMARRIRVRR